MGRAGKSNYIYNLCIFFISFATLAWGCVSRWPNYVLTMKEVVNWGKECLEKIRGRFKIILLIAWTEISWEVAVRWWFNIPYLTTECTVTLQHRSPSSAACRMEVMGDPAKASITCPDNPTSGTGTCPWSHGRTD